MWWKTRNRATKSQVLLGVLGPLLLTGCWSLEPSEYANYDDSKYDEVEPDEVEPDAELSPPQEFAAHLSRKEARKARQQGRASLRRYLEGLDENPTGDQESTRTGRARCIDVTTYDYNWDNDMRCTRPDGSVFYTDYAGAARFD